jgi:hypothetical protein
MPKVFLSAQWRDLILANYSVDPGLLTPRLPDGLELDLFEGQAVCSLVGFMFLETRVKGIHWPGYSDFPEINLRFYVREKGSDRRGVVFVRELVRHRFVAFVARSLYNEPYVHARINESITQTETERRVGYEFTCNGGNGHLRVIADPSSSCPLETSAEHWFKEHQWGYGTTKRGRTLRYEVGHPIWNCHGVRSHDIEVDWSRIYGPEWSHMRDEQPLSVILAQGSPITVHDAEPLTIQRA